MGVITHSGTHWSQGAGTPPYSDRRVSEALPGWVGAPRASKGSCKGPCPTQPWAAPDPVALSPALSHCIEEQWPCPSCWYQALPVRGSRQTVAEVRGTPQELCIWEDKGQHRTVWKQEHLQALPLGAGFGYEGCSS